MAAWLALMPFSRLAELPLLVMAVWGLVLLLRPAGRAMVADGAFALLGMLWLTYALPMALASLDAVAPVKSWASTLASLRFLLAGAFAIHMLRAELRRQWLVRLASLVVVFWAIDAAVQAVVGVNLLGMPMSPDRLNGVFGETNIKLGPVLAVLAPIPLELTRRYGPRWALGAVYALLLAVVIGTGTRAAWVMMAWVTLCYLYLYARREPRRWLRALGWVGAIALSVGVVGYQVSEPLADRVDRSLLIFSGDRDSVDRALSRRLPIWETAAAMAASHPVNGVGPRGFRHAYGDYAQPGDPWFDAERNLGSTHAHQLFLEILTETGLIGLAGFLLALALAWRAWRSWSPARRLDALPWAIALGAMLFPINTHLAFYSTFWSLLFWWLVIAYCLDSDRTTH